MSNIAKWKLFSEDEIREIVKKSRSYRDMAERMGYKPDGGSTSKTMKELIKKFNLDTSHFLGAGWNKENYDYSRFEKGSKIHRGSANNALIALRGRKCENCGIEEWLGQPINLEVHHIDGDRTNNNLENLQLLCPNCHSYTENFCSNKIKNKREVSDEEFVKALAENKSIRQALIQLQLTPAGGNYERAWNLIYEYDIKHLKKK